VYLILEVLTGSKRYYSEMEKNCYAVVMNARNLHHYFEAHTIHVLMNQNLNDIFHNRDSSHRISKWVMEILKHVVEFEKRSAIKSQIITNFVAEWMELSSRTKGLMPESPWLIYYD
jgi:hypothetical protein